MTTFHGYLAPPTTWTQVVDHCGECLFLGRIQRRFGRAIAQNDFGQEGAEIFPGWLNWYWSGNSQILAWFFLLCESKPLRTQTMRFGLGFSVWSFIGLPYPLWPHLSSAKLLSSVSGEIFKGSPAINRECIFFMAWLFFPFFFLPTSFR